MVEDSLILHKMNIKGRNKKNRPPTLAKEEFFPGIMNIRRKMTWNKHNYWAEGKDLSILQDRDGWILLFSDYAFIDCPENTLCKNIVLRNRNNLSLDEDRLIENIKLLFCFYDFDISNFKDIIMYQKDVVGVIKQVVKKDCFMNNRFRRGKKLTSIKARIHPSRHKNIPLPIITNICDGINFPVAVSKYEDGLEVKNIECDNFGEGDFICMGGDVIDCIRINDFWVIDKDFSLRSKMLYRCQENQKEYLECWGFQDMMDACRLLGVNSRDGVLVREIGQDLLKQRWFRWSKDSCYLAPKMFGDRPNVDSMNFQSCAFFDLEDNIVKNVDISNVKGVCLDQHDILKFKGILDF